MDPTTPIAYRPLIEADVPAAYAVFRRSLFDYLFRIGMVDAATATDPPIESAWASQGPWVGHLSATAAENWVAEDVGGKIIGWAMSTERDGVLELTHFFVEPGTQARGVGRALLERAFPLGRGRHRVILYLRFGVGYVTTSMDMFRAPEAVEQEADLQFERLAADEASVRAVGDIEQVILGHRRDIDARFLLRMRPAWLARRGDAVAGVAFGAQGSNSGPIAALDPADMPALLALYFSVPMVNDVAVRHLLARGFQIDPFYVKVLADTRSMQLDRWIHTGPAFIV
jgi:GNAT superfamily N-acetyltransferase